MQQSYTRNYVKIYFWQLSAILLNLLALFIVIPQLSSQPNIYGIYSICVSSIVFLSYADIGFINAGFKYASEYYAQGKRKEELNMLGFVSFILLICALAFAAVFVALSFNPAWLIKGLTGPAEVGIARKLLLILAVFSPNIVLQRALTMIFGVRLEDFIYQRVQIFINLGKILSVFYFYRPGHSDIVGYFLFTQIATSAGLIIAFMIAVKKYDISPLALLGALKFSRKLYDEVKALAFSTFFLTISWILYYELDLYAIARLSGATAVAYYSIGMTCLSFFRAIFGTLFNPFSARFNHFIALNDGQGLKQLYQTVLCVMLPVVVLPILSIFCLSKPFIYTWVGPGFDESIPIVELLIMCNIFAFISYPSNILLIARKEIKLLYSLAIIQPVIFWVGIAVLFPFLDYLSFAYFKLVIFCVSGFFYLWVSIRFLGLSLDQFWNKIVKPAILPVLYLIVTLYFISGYLPQEKNKSKLLVVIATGGIVSATALMLYYATSAIFRNYINNLYNKLGFTPLHKEKTK